MHVNLMDDVSWKKQTNKKAWRKALMLTKLGSKSLAVNNYRINEDAANNGRGHCGRPMHVHIWKHMQTKARALVGEHHQPAGDALLPAVQVEY